MTTLRWQGFSKLTQESAAAGGFESQECRKWERHHSDEEMAARGKNAGQRVGNTSNHRKNMKGKVSVLLQTLPRLGVACPRFLWASRNLESPTPGEEGCILH